MNSIQSLLDQSKVLAPEKPEISLELASQAHKLSMTYNNPEFTALALFNMAYACRVKSDYSKALEYGYQSFDIYKRINSHKGMLKSSNIIGIIYFCFGAYSDALHYFLKAVELIAKVNDPNLETSIYNNIGEVHRIAKDYRKSLEYYFKSIELCDANNLEKNKAVIYLNIGEVYYQLGQTEESFNFLQNAHGILSKHSDLINQGEAETKLGRALLAKGDFTAAASYFESAKIKLMHVNNKFYFVELLIEQAHLDLCLGNNPVKIWNDALSLAQLYKFDNKISAIYESLSKYYESQGDFNTALTYYKAYHMKEKENNALNLSKQLEVLSFEHKHFHDQNEKHHFEELSNKLMSDMVETKKELNELIALNSTLMNDIMMDELTQVFNRRGIEKNLEAMFSAHTSVHGTILLVDIDYFKNYNDTHGHVQGDICLKALSSALKQAMPADSFIGRYGGEEFLCFVPIDSFEKSYAFAEQLRKTSEALGHVTISIGGYVGPLTLDTIHQTIHQADMALYKAKESGRNQVLIQEAPL